MAAAQADTKSTPPTAEELSEYSFSPSNKPYARIIHSDPNITVYSRVPMAVLEPFRAYLDGTYDRIYDARVKVWKKEHPNAKKQKLNFLWPADDFDGLTFRKAMEPFEVVYPYGFMEVDNDEELFISNEEW
jgi:hypothetical protein